MLYGTNSSGTKGWYAQPSGSGTSYLTTFSSFTIPAVGSTVNVTVGANTDMVVGESHILTDGTHFINASVTVISGTTITYQNNGGTGGSTSGTMSAGHIYVGGPEQIDNNTAHFLRGDNTFATPPSATATVAGYVPTPPNNTHTFLRGDATFNYAVPEPWTPFFAQNGMPPASAHATLASVNSTYYLSYAASVISGIVFPGVVPKGVDLGGGVVIRIRWSSASATSGAVVWGVAMERFGTATIASDHWSTQQTGTTTVGGTVDIEVETAITITNVNLPGSLAAGDTFRLQVQRVGTNASDTMAGAAQLTRVSIKSAN